MDVKGIRRRIINSIIKMVYPAGMDKLFFIS
jgi:hypothetical protein